LPGDERNNGKALSLIVLHVAHSLNHIVAFCTSAREAWQKLSDHFQGFGLVGSVSEMCAQVNSIVSELAMIGEPVPALTNSPLLLFLRQYIHVFKQKSQCSLLDKPYS
jgi:hypothetical protein